MIPIDQTVSDAGRGDCHRATLASCLELDITQVPNFRLFSDSHWFHVYYSFLWSCGWNYEGTGGPSDLPLDPKDSFNGFFIASVKSRNFEGKTHSVVINAHGVVVHDPSPHKKHLGENIIESGELIAFEIVSPRTDEGWKAWAGK